MSEVIDQAVHFGAAFLILAVSTLIGADLGIPSGAFLGLCLGLVREITEDGPITSGGSIRDLVFWTLGGAAAGVL